VGVEDWPFVSCQGLQGRQRGGRRVGMVARGVGRLGRGGDGRGQGGRGLDRRGVGQGGGSLRSMDEGGMDVEESDTERREYEGGKKKETESLSRLTETQSGAESQLSRLRERVSLSHQPQSGAESQRGMGMYDLLAALTGALGQP
jgi:hypothetical protein